MFKILKNFFEENQNENIKSFNDLNLLCGLMIEAANIDGVIEQKEVNKISKALIETFDENPKAVEVELTKCLNELGDSKSLHFFTSKINQTFDKIKKIKLIEILWEIILEDEKIHDFESSLIRRLSGLLYISDVQCGLAKKEALKNVKFRIKKNL